MTVAANNPSNSAHPAGAARRSGTTKGSPWHRVWQIPLLIAGLTAFAYGVKAIVRTVHPVAFEVQAAGVRTLITGEKYKEAIDRINELGRFYKEPLQQAELQSLTGDTYYLVQQQQPAIVQSNYKGVIRHYEDAVKLGLAPTSTMNERWGEAALALGDAKLAVEKLEAALVKDPALVKAHARELVSAYAAGGQPDKAQRILEKLLSVEELKEDPEGRAAAVDDRAWALCKQIEIAIASHSPELGKILDSARRALEHIPERDPSGRILTWIGRAELERGDADQAQKDLAEARSRFVLHHLDDGRAAVLLAKISESKKEWDKAVALYQDVVTAQAGTPVWAAARLGRGNVVSMQKGEVSEQSRGDYRYAIQAVTSRDGTAPELISREGVEAALLMGYQRSSDAGKLADALTYLSLQQEMGDPPAYSPERTAMSLRLATTRERLANRMLEEAEKADLKSRDLKEAQARAMCAEAAEEYLRHARFATMDDSASANSLWKAAGLFDKAGKPMRSVAVYEQFSIQRPQDPRVPEALLSAGRLYQSAGMFDKAIASYQRNLKDNPKTQGAYSSAVNLARCYMTLVEAAPNTPEGILARKDSFEKAEGALLSLVQNNSDLEPSAVQFRVTLFTLGELYYRNGRWADAILRLGEAVERYPKDAGVPRALFMLAESFRKSAGDIGDAIKKDPAIAGRDALENARSERLLEAAGLFTRVIGLLDSEADVVMNGAPSAASPVKLTPLESEYVRTSYMDRAECYFDRGEFAMAIKLYDEAATRFSEEALAVRAYVQIVNAYMALKEPTQAAAAAERGRWILKRIPDEAFKTSVVPADRAYYEKLLALGKV